MFHSRERAKQLIDFSGLRFGKLMLTDIDAIFDYKNKGWLIIEVKTKGERLSLGQKIAIERMTDELGRSKPALAMVVEHETSTDTDVDLATCLVTSVRVNGAWRKIKKQITTRQLFLAFIKEI